MNSRCRIELHGLSLMPGRKDDGRFRCACGRRLASEWKSSDLWKFLRSPEFRPVISSAAAFSISERSAFVPSLRPSQNGPNFRFWREAGDQPSIRAAAICGPKPQRCQDVRRRSPRKRVAVDLRNDPFLEGVKQRHGEGRVAMRRVVCSACPWRCACFARGDGRDLLAKNLCVVAGAMRAGVFSALFREDSGMPPAAPSSARNGEALMHI